MMLFIPGSLSGGRFRRPENETEGPPRRDGAIRRSERPVAWPMWTGACQRGEARRLHSLRGGRVRRQNRTLLNLLYVCANRPSVNCRSRSCRLVNRGDSACVCEIGGREGRSRAACRPTEIRRRPERATARARGLSSSIRRRHSFAPTLTGAGRRSPCAPSGARTRPHFRSRRARERKAAPERSMGRWST